MNKFRQGLGNNRMAAIQRMLLFLLMVAGVPAYASEEDALRISNNIQALHMPYGVIMDPVFAAPTSEEIVGYSRTGDSAIWTGHYLAAEAFRYRVTGSPEAFDNLRRALSGIRSLMEITGSDVLARTLVPIDSPYADGILVEEGGHGTFTGTLGDKTYHWIGNTSRDQYVGIFFGLGVAYDAVEDREVPEVLEARSSIQEIVTRLLDFLLRNNWAVIMPNGQISAVFWGRT